jgi:Raf kinase inhibitor-like YbhB/YbcL family protein
MRGILALVVFTAAVVAVGLFGYVNHKIIPIGYTENAMDTNSAFSLTSSVFDKGTSIPAKFTCDGSEVNPPLSISGVPAGTQSLALVMVDPDIPQTFKDQMHIDEYVHWVLFDIPPETTEIATGTTVGTSGANSAGKNQYAAPCPPPQYEPSEHRYIFTLYALDSTLPLTTGASEADVEQAMDGHIISQTELIGLYKRK